ncbi:MAG TPA: MucR family transcriptional regulator [Alphaproteobacteria bacterium]|nr:MucR family transcriptional regulator [Alphaproteobacteria bacterium]
MAEHSPNSPSERLAALTAQIAASYVGRNNVAANDMPQLIATIYQSLAKLGQGGAMADNRPAPAISVKRSVAPDYIVCLEDGKKLKMLKRHLKTSYNLTPEQYRERWNLPADYPMVAPNYAKQRSRLAKQIGLGTASRRTPRQKAA